MRDPEQTMNKIKAAAFEEFSAYGISGARIDRIAKQAGCNKNNIYIYFGSKEELFKTVLGEQLIKVYETIDFDVSDLDNYARIIFDFSISNNKIMRLLSWYYLDNDRPAIEKRTQVQKKKVQAMKQAQESGMLTCDFSPEFLFSVIMTISMAWSSINPFRLYDPTETKDKLEQTKEELAKLITKITT